MNPARQGEASVVERVGGAEVIEQFKKSLGAIAAVARKADLVELRELAQLFFPADLEALDLVLSKLDAMDRVTAVSDAPPDSPVDSFARPHAYELKIERMIAAGRASTKLHAIRIVRREFPRLFESYRMERLAGKKRTA